MKQFQLAASVFVSSLLLAHSAMAQVSYKGEAMPPAPAFNWSGFYAGLNVGAVNHTMNVTDTQAITFHSTIQQVSNPRITGGLEVGYRRQMDMSAVSAVYGLELSANFSDAKFKKEYGAPFALYQLESKNELETVCLLELLGGIAADRTLLFLAGGVAWTNVNGKTTNQDSIGFFNSFSVKKQLFGTALGAGIEYAFNEKISARIKVDVIKPNTYNTSDNLDNSFFISDSIVQGTFAINYKFA